MLDVIPKCPPGLTVAALEQKVLPHLPQELFPNVTKAGWWTKTVQLDLEAKGILAREKTIPLAYVERERWQHCRLEPVEQCDLETGLMPGISTCGQIKARVDVCPQTDRTAAEQNLRNEWRYDG